MSSSYLIIGSSGQIGSALLAGNSRALGVGREQLDLGNPEQVKSYLDKLRPRFVINAAAMTGVDLCETEPQKAFATNAEGVGGLARWCATSGAWLVHFSSDYVFSGEKNEPYRETDAPAPINVYGQSKLRGEELVAASGCLHLLLRTSWVFASDGQNFVNTMVRLGSKQKELRIVSDQIGAPSYAPHLAAAVWRAIASIEERPVSEQSELSGLYHCTSSGEISWFGFALEIFARLEVGYEAPRLVAISSSEYKAPAKRPRNSRLSCEKFCSAFAWRQPHWREGLADYAAAKRVSHGG